MANAVTRRLRALFRREQLERELDEELRFHLEKETELLMSRGMSEAAFASLLKCLLPNAYCLLIRTAYLCQNVVPIKPLYDTKNDCSISLPLCRGHYLQLL